MEHSSSQEANSYSRSQETFHLLWNPKVHYHVHNSFLLDAVLSQKHPVCTFPSCFSEINYNIILPSMPQSSEWSYLFQPKFCVHSSCLHVCYMICPSYPPLFYLLNNIWWSVQVTKFFIMIHTGNMHFEILNGCG